MVETSVCAVQKEDVREKLASFGQDNPKLPPIFHLERMDYFSSLVADIANSFVGIFEIGRSTPPWKKGSPDIAGFDPLALAFAHNLRRDTGEACWLLFLSSYFGRHPKHHWDLLEKVYLGPGMGDGWTWENASADPVAFAGWLVENQPELSRHGNMGRAHKYVSFGSYKAMKTAGDIQTYISWVINAGGHRELFPASALSEGGSPSHIFDRLYAAMNMQLRCKKAITFNYLSLLGILGLAGIEPARPYLSDHLPSKLGANWLFGGNAVPKRRANELEPIVTTLAHYLELPFIIPVLHQAFAQIAAGSHAEAIQRFRWRHNR